MQKNVKIQHRRGLKANLPVLDEGEIGFCTDTNEIFMGTASGNEKFDNQEVLSQLAEKAAITYVDDEISKKANGAPKGVYTTVADLEAAYPTGDANNYIVIGNVAEISSLDITAAPTTAGNVTVTLDGIGTNIAVDPAVETTAGEVATKIRNTAFTGWTTGGTGTNITFTANEGGVKADATYSDGGTGATGTISTTTQGVDPDNRWYYWNGSTWAAGDQYLTNQWVNALTKQDEPWSVI